MNKARGNQRRQEPVPFIMRIVSRQTATRILAITALLAALGAVSGAATGLLLLIAISVAGSQDVFRPGFLHSWAAAGGLGAIVGSLMGTPIALIFLRRVPLWRATVETAGAAGLGAAAASSIPLPFAWPYGALLCAMLAALRLRYVYRERGQAQTDSTPA